MADDQNTLDKGEYISIREAANRTGFSRDYVTHLARIGKVAGRKIGPTWYVAYPSLQQYLVLSEHERAVRWKELSELRRRERAAASPPDISPHSIKTSTSAGLSDANATWKVVKFYTIELSQLADGAMLVSMMATTIDEEEPQLLSQEITSERVASIDDALAVIKRGVTGTNARS